jgi:DNA-binding MarR family transcriptional regulator
MPRQLSFDPVAEAARQWQTHWGDEAVTSMAAVTSVMRAHQLLLAELNSALEPYGLTFPRYEALMLLYYSRAGSLPLGKMGARLQVHQTSVTSLIDGLEGTGMLQREPHPTDRRTTLATITTQGRTAAAAATATLNGIRFGTEPLGDEELASITAVLEKFRRSAGDFSTE